MTLESIFTAVIVASVIVSTVFGWLVDLHPNCNKTKLGYSCKHNPGECL